MDYCFFSSEKTDTSYESLNLSLVWQVEADSSYHIAYKPDTDDDTFVAIRTISGEGELITENGRYPLTENTLLILPIRTVLEYYTTAPLWSFYWFEFTGILQIEPHFCSAPITESEYCLLGDLISALCSPSNSLAQAGFKYLFSRWLSTSNEDAADVALQVAKYINASPTEAALSFESLLTHFNVSERTLRKRFQDAFGMSPKQYILDKRLKLACILLKTTDMRLKDISAKTGFQNEYYFSTCFKRHYGMSPTEHRSKQ